MSSQPRCHLADSRQLLTKEHIEHTRATDLRFHEHHARMLSDYFPNNASIASMDVLPHAFHDGVSMIARNNGDQFAFIGDIEWIEAKNFTSAAYGVAHGDFGFLQQHSHLGSRSTFVQDGCHAAASWVAKAVDIQADVEHVAHQFMQSSAIAFNDSFELESFPLRKDGHSVVADITTQNDLVSLPSIHDFGIPGDKLNARAFRGFAHRCHDPAQFVCAKAFFQYERRSQVERTSAAHG